MEYSELDQRTGRAEVVRHVYETLPVILGSVTGPDHRYIASNAAHRALLGQTDFIGKSMLEVNPEMAGQELQRMMDRTLETATMQRMQDWRLQTVNPVDGSVVERYIDATLYPRFAPDGRVDGINSITVDVTDHVKRRLRAEREAAEAQERYQRSRDVVRALQRALLPPGVPVFGDAEVAAAYLPAGVDAGAGGDWYDTVRTPDGRLAMAVGDVVGHGVAAAAVMGQLRAVLRERLEAGATVPESFEALDRVSRSIGGASSATVCVVILDTATGQLEYCTAGHPGPLVLAPDGSARSLSVSGATPLGSDSPFDCAFDTLGMDEVLLLYTDGIVERPGLSHADGVEQLGEVAGAICAGRTLQSKRPLAEQVCRQSIELLVRVTGHSDDITLLAARRVYRVPQLQLQLPATPQSVTRSRTVLHGWLLGFGVAGPTTHQVLQALDELVSNAVLHAYADADRPGDVEVLATVDEHGVLNVSVLDHGRWRTAVPDRERLHGLDMVVDLVDRLHVDRSAGGTRATFSLALLRSAELFGVHGLEPTGQERGNETLLIMRHDEPSVVRVVLDGPVDITTAEALRHELVHARLLQRPALLVDFARVTLLSSAGVSVLHESLRECDRDGLTMQMAVPQDSPIRRILQIVGLPWVDVAA